MTIKCEKRLDSYCNDRDIKLVQFRAKGKRFASGRNQYGDEKVMNDENVRVPFVNSPSNVISIQRDGFAVTGFSAGEVTDTVGSLDRLIKTYGFDNVALNVADALIHLRVRMDTEHAFVAKDVEARLVDLEQRVRDFNAKRSTAGDHP